MLFAEAAEYALRVLDDRHFFVYDLERAFGAERGAYTASLTPIGVDNELSFHFVMFRLSFYQKVIFSFYEYILSPHYDNYNQLISCDFNNINLVFSDMA